LEDSPPFPLAMGKRTVERTEEEIAAEALAAKKAAKKSKKAAAAAAVEDEEEEDPEAVAAARKAAKKAKKAAAGAAAAEEDEEEVPAPKQKKTDKDVPAPKQEEPKPAAAAEDDEFKDQTYKCCDCNEDWIDTAGEQQFRWDKGFAETPKRCKDCRWAKKVRMDGGDPTAKGKGKGNKELEIFIGGLPYSTTEDVLRKDFEECGEIVNFRMPLNDEGNARGIAFCEYATQEGVEKALKFNETEYGGRYLSVRKSGDDKGKGKGKDGKGKSKGNKELEVFIGGLPFSTTEETLKKDFAECGEIVNFRMPLNDEGNPRGIAFIEYKDKEACDKALKFHETDYGGRSLSVKMSGDGGGKGDKGDKGKGKGKKGKKGKAPSESFAKNTGCIVAGTGEKKTFADSDSE
jgi:nucleolin